MSQAMAACELCKVIIPRPEFEKGAAITVLGKSYCGRCKRTVKNVTFQPAPEPVIEPSPGSAAPPATAAAKAPPPAKATTPRGGQRRPAAVVRKPSRMIPFLVAGGIFAFAGIIAVAFLLTTGKDSHRRPGDPAAAPPNETAEERAQRTFDRAQDLVAQGEKPEDALKALDEAAVAGKGTPLEPKVAELRARFEKTREAIEGERRLQRLIDELKALVEKDRDFGQYDAVMAKADEARGLAARTAPSASPQIQRLVSEYTERYEKQAEPYADLYTQARGLADEKRHDDALKLIETFPAPLRKSRLWRSLEGLRKTIEEAKRGAGK